ncbi:unnamed protein product [Penicillium olsonii]|nr:unnamed protein product [Penicillium olsonii]CAG7933346.1 unnamed protein product [Penicillium olsonii]
MTMEDTKTSEAKQEQKVWDETNAVGRSPPEIEHLYLDFDTPLPQIVFPLRNDGFSMPPCPELSQYASPFLWSKTRKVVITIISSCVTGMACYEAGAYTAPSEELTAKWNISKTQFNLGITLYMLAFAIAPMVLAPFSEINGRRPVFVLSGLLFTASLIGCGATESFAGMLLARFFLGIGGSTYIMRRTEISPCHASQAQCSLAGLGPLVTGFIAHRTNWRWIHYSVAIMSFCLVLILFFFLKETRGNVLLSRKANALNRYYQALESAGCEGVVFEENMAVPHPTRRIRWKVRSDEERGSILQMLSYSSLRPFRLLFTEPVVFFFSIWVSFSWGILFLQFIALPLVYSTNHNFNVEQTGAIFSAVSIGALIATPLSIFQERFARQFGNRFKTPEGRLYFTCVQSILMPIGMFWFGWTSFQSVPWIVPTLAVGCSTIGIFSIYLATFNYLADTYHRYASSALAAQSFCRNVLAATFPLFTNTMFTNLGYPAASSLLGGIGVFLTIVPWVLVLYGPRIRARSKFASEL